MRWRVGERSDAQDGRIRVGDRPEVVGDGDVVRAERPGSFVDRHRVRRRLRAALMRRVHSLPLWVHLDGGSRESKVNLMFQPLWDAEGAVVGLLHIGAEAAGG